ncbi:MAG: hypothetical protein CM15mP51_22100 [Porticoccaceae bacterium]|nr:MAG: hypothetical protein CM15mP51_22100 [Porticoccaceae bacterium]
MPSFAASLETAEMVAVSISSWVFTSETVAQTSSIQASTLMYPHPMKPFGDFTMRRGAPRLMISLSNPDQSKSLVSALIGDDPNEKNSNY